LYGIVEGDPPGNVFTVPVFPCLFGLSVVFELNFYCTYTIDMTKLIYNYLIGGTCMNS